jgi:hypothetical protein
VSIVVDSSGSMLLTPEIVTFPETCVALNFNPCTAAINPSPAQETCNACAAWTTRAVSSCATNWSSTCRTQYGECWRFFNGGTPPACGQVLGVTDGVSTRGDGSALTPGCDVDGDGMSNDSRFYQAKEALRSVLATATAEVALWRWAQVEGGQTCTIDAQCPDTPGGQSVLTCELVSGTNRCVLDAAVLGSAVGQCAPLTWNGADSSFSCSACSESGTNTERLECEAYAMGAIRTGGASPLGPTVNCALPTTNHPYLASHGAVGGATCDPGGGERLVDFPAPGGGSNRPLVEAWIDHVQADLGLDVELTASGASPIAGGLRDLRTALLATLTADPRVECRPYRVVLVLDGPDGCEPGQAVTAAAALQDLSFTSPGGQPVTGFDVPVHVIGFAACPPASPNCATALEMNAIAAAGGTGAAVFVSTQAQLAAALGTLTDDPPIDETCNGSDDDCDGLVDEGFPDGDADTLPDCRDNCPAVANVSQVDTDLDQVGDACDNCPLVFNPDTQGRRAPRCRPGGREPLAAGRRIR